MADFNRLSEVVRRSSDPAEFTIDMELAAPQHREDALVDRDRGWVVSRYHSRLNQQSNNRQNCSRIR
jgi:hypothetical protein